MRKLPRNKLFLDFHKSSYTVEMKMTENTHEVIQDAYSQVFDAIAEEKEFKLNSACKTQNIPSISSIFVLQSLSRRLS